MLRILMSRFKYASWTSHKGRQERSGERRIQTHETDISEYDIWDILDRMSENNPVERSVEGRVGGYSGDTNDVDASVISSHELFFLTSSEF
jgi:hypothetical protein